MARTQKPHDPLTEILDASPVGVSISRVDDGVVLYVNQVMANYFGVSSAQDGIGVPTNLYINADDQVKVRQALKTQGEVRRLAIRNKNREGLERSSLFSYKLIQYQNIPAILCWLEDETERDQREQAILSASRQVELLHQIAGICNRAVNFYDALRKSAAEVARGLGWPICLVYRLSHGDDEVLELASMSLPKDRSEFEPLRSNLIGRAFRKGEDLPGRVLATKQIEWIEDTAADQDLSRLSAEDSVPLLSALGVPVLVEDRVIAVLELLTDQRVSRNDQLILTLSQISSELARVHIRDLTTVALQEARAEAESSARAKASFLAAMSHEVRTPMNGVVGMVDLVLQTKLDDEQRFMLQTVKDSGQALITVINDILDFSKIEAGRLEIEDAKFSIQKVVEDVAMSLAPAAAQKSLSLIAYVDPNLPETVVGDAVRVRQILSNLGSNAVKFSEHGEVVIKAEAAPRSADDTIRVRFSVRDEGLGISAEAKSRLFEEFQQADTSTTRRFGGTGLGLAICHRLTTLMGGEISVDSLLGVGSEFHCLLPFADPGETVQERTELAGLRVLVVAESADQQKVCRDYLGVWKAQTIVAARVRDAAAQFQQAQKSGRPIDVVVIPHVDDARQVLSLRQGLADAGLFPFPRFVMGRNALTGNDQVKDIGEITFMDVNPIRRAVLVSAVAIAAGRASPETPVLEPQDFTAAVAVPSVDEALAQGRLILVAEDHVANREVIRRQLNRLGYACDMAEDGAIALKMWNSKQYALLLTDCHMPNMDGFGLTAAVRDGERGTGRHAPIIAVTANVLQGEAERCLAAGMDAFLPKPVEMKTLNETLAKWMGHAGAPPMRDVAGSNGSPSHETVDPYVLDLNRMIDSFGSIDDEVRELYGIYIDSVSPLISQFYDEVADEERLLEARETIHKAKGATANVGGKELAALMAEIEIALVQKNYDAARTRSHDIAPAWDRLVDAIAHV